MIGDPVFRVVEKDPDGVERKQRVADLYFESDPKHTATTITLHHAVLRSNKRRVTSYQALRTLYQRTGELAKAVAIEDALNQLAEHVIEDKIDALFDGPLASDTMKTARAGVGDESVDSGAAGTVRRLRGRANSSLGRTQATTKEARLALERRDASRSAIARTA